MILKLLFAGIEICSPFEKNAVIGDVPGLVEGEGQAFHNAKARLEAYTKAKKEALQVEKLKATSAGSTQYESIVFEESYETDIAETAQIKAVMEHVASMTKEEMEKFREEGEIVVKSSTFVGGDEDIDYKEYQATLQKAIDATNAAFEQRYADSKLLGGLQNFAETMATSYTDIDTMEEFLNRIENSEMITAQNAYIANELGGKQEFEKLVKALKEEYSGIVGMDKALDQYSDLVASSTIENIDSQIELQNSNSALVKSLDKLTNVMKASADLVSDLSENGSLSWNSISGFTKTLEEMGVADDIINNTIAKLSDPKLNASNLGKTLSDVYQKVFANEKLPIAQLQVSRDWKQAEDVMTKMLSGANVGNARELAQYFNNVAKAELEIKDYSGDIEELWDNGNNTLKDIAEQYGLIDTELYNII